MSRRFKGPGKHFRKGISLNRLAEMFPDEAAAERWFVRARWPDGIACPTCASKDIAPRRNRVPTPYRCRSCGKDFSVKTGSVMHKSKLSLRTWVYALYLLMTSLKGVSSMKLARDLQISQKSAWFLSHRIRLACAHRPSGAALFKGPVEVDETYMGGLARNRHESNKAAARGTAGKAPVAAILDRARNEIRAEAVFDTTKFELQGFIEENVAPGATVYTDDHPSYKGMPQAHEAVRHSTREYVRGEAHTNGVESFWATLKRGYQGVYHKISYKHLDRYVQEFAFRHNVRRLDTMAQLTRVVQAMGGQRMTFETLIA